MKVPCSTASDSKIETDADEVLPEAVDVGEHALGRDVERFRGGVDDALIGLVRDEEGNVARSQLDALERDARRFHHARDGRFKDLAAEHVHVVIKPRRQSGRIDRIARAAGGNVEHLRGRAVGTEFAAQETVLFRALEHRGAGSITEEDRGRTVGVIDDARQLLRTDQQHAPENARTNKTRRHAQSIDETAACDFDVERGLTDRSQFRRDDARRGRKRVVRRDGCDDVAVDVVGFEAGPLQRDARGADRHVAARDAVGSVAALFHSCTCGDPLVARIEPPFEVFVGYDDLGDIVTDARDADAEERRGHTTTVHCEEPATVPAALSVALSGVLAFDLRFEHFATVVVAAESSSELRALGAVALAASNGCYGREFPVGSAAGAGLRAWRFPLEISHGFPFRRGADRRRVDSSRAFRTFGTSRRAGPLRKRGRAGARRR